MYSDEISTLIKQLGDESTFVRRSAVLGLEKIGTTAVPALIDALGSENSHTRRLAAEALGKIGPLARHAIPALTMVLQDDNPQIRQSVVEALGKIGKETSDAVPALATALNDGIVNVRRSAAQSLIRIGRHSIQVLAGALEDSDTDIRQWAAEGLGKLGASSQEAFSGLVKLLNDPYEDVSRAAAEALQRIGPDAIPTLELAITTTDSEVLQDMLKSILEQIRRVHGIPSIVRKGEYPSRNDVLDDAYKILKQIGQGAEAYVYKAATIKSLPAIGLEEGEHVIVKYYKHYDPSDKNRMEINQDELIRWFRGYALTKDRPIDGLRRVIDYKEHWVAVLQWVPGETLNEVIDARTGHPPNTTRLRGLTASFLRILDAMIQLNRRNLVFRDLKPHNVIITTAADGHQIWTLIDTGLLTEIDYSGTSSLTTKETSLGTPQYGAPELIDDAAEDSKNSEAVDIYSVGSTLYKLVTGREMFSGTLTRILRTKLSFTGHDQYIPPARLNPHVDNRLSEIIRKCAQFRPEDRYPTLQLIYNDLTEWIGEGTEVGADEVELGYDAFIAYASPDVRQAIELYDQLVPPYNVFLDRERLQPGGRWPDEVRTAQTRSQMTLVLLSRNTSTAHYQVEEITRAIELSTQRKRHKVVPIYLESIEPPYGLAVFQRLELMTLGSISSVAKQLMSTCLSKQKG